MVLRPRQRDSLPRLASQAQSDVHDEALTAFRAGKTPRLCVQCATRRDRKLAVFDLSADPPPEVQCRPLHRQPES